MTKRIQKLILAGAALSALALGGSAIASAQSGGTHAKPPSQAAQAPGTSGNQAAAEQPSAPEQSGSESAAISDGPGGHADEPGNATADHQFQGQE